MSTDADETGAPDWTNLPDGTPIVSLHVALHDSSLVRVEQDRAKKRVVLEFSILYICQFHQLPEDTHFLMQFDDVQSARVNMSARTGYEESGSWQDFSSSLGTSHYDLEVMDADMVRPATGGTTLRLLGFYGKDKVWMSLFLQAGWMKIFRSDGVDLNISDFLRLGAEYWGASGGKVN